MLGIDAARVADPVITSSPGEGLVSAKKKAKAAPQKPKTPPVFSSEERDLQIQVPDGWRVGR